MDLDQGMPGSLRRVLMLLLAAGKTELSGPGEHNDAHSVFAQERFRSYVAKCCRMSTFSNCTSFIKLTQWA